MCHVIFSKMKFKVFYLGANIDGFVFSSVNQWGYYDSKNNNAIVPFDYWNSYVNNGTPGDQILVLPGSDYGVYGPIGTIRIENIREGNED